MNVRSDRVSSRIFSAALAPERTMYWKTNVCFSEHAYYFLFIFMFITKANMVND